MKKSAFFLIIMIIAVSYATAQKSVALHSNGTTTIFGGDSPLVDAYNASVSGDTLYVSGGNFTAPAEIDKGLVIIGAGYHPDSTAVTQKTYLMYSNNLVIGENASNLYLEGMEFQAGLSKTSESVTGFTFIRCKMNGGLDFSITTNNIPQTKASIVQCDIGGGMKLQGVTYSVISNCILRGAISNSNNNTIKNNAFLYGYYSHPPLESCVSNIFSNNIFSSDTGPCGNGCSLNTFQKNVLPGANPSFGGTATDLNNYKEIIATSVYVNTSEEDYHLLGDAKTTYLGDNETEVGIYGGMLPFKEGAVPSNPHISQKIISTTTESNGFLNITFKVSAQQN